MERSTVRGSLWVERSTVRETFVGGEIDCTGDLCGWRDRLYEGDLCGWRDRLYGRPLSVERSTVRETFVGGEVDCTGVLVGGEIDCMGDLCGWRDRLYEGDPCWWRDRLYGRPFWVERSTVREIFVGGEIDCTGALCGWRGRLYGSSLWVEGSRTAELQQSVIITSYQRHTIQYNLIVSV